LGIVALADQQPVIEVEVYARLSLCMAHHRTPYKNRKGGPSAALFGRYTAAGDLLLLGLAPLGHGDSGGLGQPFFIEVAL
jgi:hypothetical protein